jgi:hypothetical protein
MQTSKVSLLARRGLLSGHCRGAYQKWNIFGMFQKSRIFVTFCEEHHKISDMPASAASLARKSLRRAVVPVYLFTPFRMKPTMNKLL